MHSLSFPQVGSLGVDYTCLLSDLLQKLLEIEKEIVREVARGDKPYLRKSTDRKTQISPPKLNERLPDFRFAICRFSQVRFITPSHLTHNLFSYFQ